MEIKKLRGHPAYVQHQHHPKKKVTIKILYPLSHLEYGNNYTNQTTFFWYSIDKCNNEIHGFSTLFTIKT